MRPRAVLLRLALPLLLAGMLGGTLAACDGVEVDPFRQAGNYYSVYGFLDPLADSQFVRVLPLRRIIERPQSLADPLIEIDATVVSFNLTRGDSVQWDHHLVRFPDSSYGHVFGARLPRPLVGERYRLEVRRNDGAVTHAETTIPAQPRGRVGALRIERDSLVRAVTFSNFATVPDRIDLYYYALGPNDDTFFPVIVPYPREAAVRTEDGWRIDVQLTRDVRRVRDQMDLRVETEDAGVLPEDEVPIFLDRVAVFVQVLDDQWTPPNGTFDPEVLALPGTLSNVENGFGYFGAVVRGSVDWLVSPQEAGAFNFEPVGR